MESVANCAECPICSTCGQTLSYREGDKWKEVSLYRLPPIIRDYPNRILFVGDYPHLKDFSRKGGARIFSGNTIKLLKQEFGRQGIEIKGENFMTALQCHVNKKPQMKYGKVRTDVTVLSTKDITQALKCCRPEIAQVVSAKQPKLIIPFGDVALRQILKTSGVGKHRGKLTWSEEFNCWVFPMFHPLMVELDMANLPFFQADVAQVCQFIKDGFVPKQLEQTEIYQDVDSIQFILDKKDIVVAIDTETQGADWCDPNSVVISYSITDEVGKGYNIWLNQEVDDAQEATHQIFWERTVQIPQEKGKPKNKKMPVRVLLKQDPLYQQKIEELRQICLREDIKIVMMNGNYDIHRLIQLGIKREEIKKYVLDIQTGMHTLDPDNFKNASMLDIQRVLLPSRQDHKTAFGAEVDKSDMLKAAKENPGRHTAYAVADSISTLECAQIISGRLKSDPLLTRYYTKLVHPVETEVMMDIERNGMLFDMKALPAVYEEVATLINEQERQIIRLIPDKVKDMHRSKGLRLSRGDLLRDALFSKKGFGLTPIEKTPTGEPALGRKLLVRLRDSLSDDHPAKELLSLHIERGPYQKLFSTYLRGFEKAVKPDGKFHPQISKKGTGTGRTSCKSPNLQQIPKRHPKIGKMIRNLIIAPPGFVFVAADESQSELRFIAYESKDPEFVRVYRNGEDIHTNTANMLVQMQGNDPSTYSKEEIKPFRQKSKAVNFGYCLKRGTIITTDKGDVPIEDIQVGMKVLTHQKRYRKVTELQRPTAMKMIKLSTQSGKVIECTPDHKLYVNYSNHEEGYWDCKFVPACDLRVGDLLVTPSDEYDPITSISEYDCFETVYDFTVEEDHSFVANGLISHNCFGMFAKKFQAYCRDEYGISLTLSEAEAARDAFFTKYVGLLPWHQQRIADAIRDKGVRSPFGFFRHLPNITSNDFMKRVEAEHAAVNSSIQSASSDWVALSALTCKRRGYVDGVRVLNCGFVHDELLYLCKEDHVDTFIPQLLECMENPPVKELFGFELNVPMVAEASHGKTLGTLQPWERN